MKNNTNRELYVTCPMEGKTYKIPAGDKDPKNPPICPACGKLATDKRHKTMIVTQ